MRTARQAGRSGAHISQQGLLAHVCCLRRLCRLRRRLQVCQRRRLRLVLVLLLLAVPWQHALRALLLRQVLLQQLLLRGVARQPVGQRVGRQALQLLLPRHLQVVWQPG
jgi:hypothetical protein